MPDPHRIQGELATLLSRPQYASIFSHHNQFRNQYRHMKKPDDPVWTPGSVAQKTAQDLHACNGLLDPVEVVELRGKMEFYRAYDGGVRLDSARTLGRWWFERRVLQEIWNVTARYPGADRQQSLMDFLRSANFISPQNNDMKEIAVMVVPEGARVVAVRGKGNWKALRTGPGAETVIRSQGDVIDTLGMMPIPGTVQCMIPVYNDNWVTQVPKLSSDWPLLS